MSFLTSSIFCLLVLTASLTADYTEKAPPQVPEPVTTISAESEPSSFVSNVNVIFGNLLLSTCDLVQHGPEPLHFNRYYNSERGSYLWLAKSMSCNYPLWLKGQYGHLLADEEASSIVRYAAKDHSHFCLDPSMIYGGLTNTGRGEIGGSTNGKNSFYTYKDDCWTAFLSDGTKREYSSSKAFTDFVHVKKETRPNGNILRFHYDKERLERIESQSHDGKRDFHSHLCLGCFRPKNDLHLYGHECYDHLGKVNRVHPKRLNGQELISSHYPPTAIELGL